jgi:atypical dual specificity phosphatase
MNTNVSEIEPGLHISSIQYVMDRDVEDKFDIIITVCRNEPATPEPCPVSWQQFGLYDRSHEQQETFDQAVQATVKAITTHPDADVLVHCIAGQSRSPAVVATALAYRDDIHFDEARDRIFEQRPQIAIHPSLREHGLAFLGQDDRKPFQ